MSTTLLLSELDRLGVEVTERDGRLECTAPDGALTPALITLLRESRDDILDTVRRGGSVGRRAAQIRAEVDQSTPESAGEPFPLTDMQQAYWVGRNADYELGDISAHTYLEFDHPALDMDRFCGAWRAVVQRHPMLRAVLTPDGQQRILPEVPGYRVAVDDLRQAGRDVVEEGLARTRQRMSDQAFQGHTWPLFEIRVTLLPAATSRIHISGDVIFADAASWQIIAAEWGQYYDNPDIELPPLEISFRDYVLAERDRRQSFRHTQSLQWWRDRLVTLPPPPDLPVAAAPATIGRPRFTRHVARIPRSNWERLRTTAVERSSTPSAVSLAAFGSVIGAWSTSSRCTLTTTLFNRPPMHPQIGSVVGDFTSFMLIACGGEPEEPFSAIVGRVQEQLHEGLEHSEVSGLELHRLLARADRHIRGAAASPVVFTSLISPRGEAMAPFGWLGRPVHSITQTPQVWLDHQVFEEEGDLVLNWDVVDGLFEPGVPEAMLKDYADLLHRLAVRSESWDEPLALANAAGRHPRRESVGTRTLAAIREILRLPDLQGGTDLVDAGASSLDLVRLLTRLEDEHGIRPKIQSFLSLHTVDQIVAFYDEQLAGRARNADRAAGSGVHRAVMPDIADIGLTGAGSTIEILTDPDDRNRFKRGRAASTGEVPILFGGAVAQPEAAALRRSHRLYAADPLAVGSLGAMLSALAEQEPDSQTSHRGYPSAGGLYAVQTYLQVGPLCVDGLPSGGYRYDPIQHGLTRVCSGTVLPVNAHAPANRSIAEGATFALIMVADLSTIEPMYGDIARDFALLEAGYAGQLLMTAAGVQGIGLCPIGAVDEETVRVALSLPDHAEIVHVLLGGPVPPSSTGAVPVRASGPDWEEGTI